MRLAGCTGWTLWGYGPFRVIKVMWVLGSRVIKVTYQSLNHLAIIWVIRGQGTQRCARLRVTIVDRLLCLTRAISNCSCSLGKMFTLPAVTCVQVFALLATLNSIYLLWILSALMISWLELCILTRNEPFCILYLTGRGAYLQTFLKCGINLQVSVNSLPLTLLVLPEGFVSHSDSVINCKGRKTAGIYVKSDEKQLLTLTVCHLENVTLKKVFTC